MIVKVFKGSIYQIKWNNGSIASTMSVNPQIKVFSVSNITKNTPNLVFPVLLYKNVLTEEMTNQSIPEKERQQKVEEFFNENTWRVEVR